MNITEIVKKYPNGGTLNVGSLGKLYFGDALVEKFKEVFGREPTQEEYWGDWYDVDFEKMKPKHHSLVSDYTKTPDHIEKQYLEEIEKENNEQTETSI